MSASTTAAPLTLARAAEFAGGDLIAGASASGAALTGASIDTRTIGPGQLFVPLAGNNVDGHEFLASAFEKGALAALCAAPQHARWAGREPGPLIVVDDVTAALQQLARRHRETWPGLLLAVTGSSGKTTTKDLVAAVMAADRPTLATRGNLNNHWGVPLTLLSIGPSHRAAVIEMGSNHPGEIAALGALAGPDHAVITNAGTAHLEHYPSVEAIAREKASLALAVPRDGVVFAGADSPGLLAALEGVPSQIVTYGFAPGADVTARSYEDLGPRGARLEVAGFPPLLLGLVGRHQSMNALAALAVARELRLDPAASVAALERYRASHARMEIRRARGAIVLVDCYNANPESTKVALETLAGWPDAVRRIALLGDMLELGPSAGALHRATGGAVRGAELWTVGAHAQDYAAGARAAGVDTRVFADKESAARELASALAPRVVVLVKGSRGAALEDVLRDLDWEAEH